MKGQKGFTLIELLMVVAIIGVLAAIAIPAMSAYRQKAQVAAARTECREIYNAFVSFNLENGMYPYQSTAPAFQLDTFAPLAYQGGIQDRLAGGKADKFDSPDIGGTNTQFYLRMTLKADPSVQLVVAQSDNVDLEPGVWLDGVFVYRNGVRIAP